MPELGEAPFHSVPLPLVLLPRDDGTTAPGSPCGGAPPDWDTPADATAPQEMAQIRTVVPAILPFALPLAGLRWRRGEWVAAGLLQVAGIVAYRTSVNRGLGVPWRYVWTHPLGAAVFTAILARAGWRKLTGRGVEWSGRTYRV